MRSQSLVLLHSPLVGPASWGALPEALRGLGLRPVVVDVTDDDQAPYASRYVARAALQINAAAPQPPVVLVAHSGAGPLVPQLAFAQRSARRAVAGYVFVDASLPRPGTPNRLDILRGEDVSLAASLRATLRDGGTFPTWTDADLAAEIPDESRRAALIAALRPRTLEFFTEQIVNTPDWPDAPCALVKTSAAYEAAARQAAERDWTVVERDGGHFAALVDPEGLAATLAEVVARL